MSSFSNDHTQSKSELSSWLKESNQQLVAIVFVADWAGTVEVLRGFLDKISLEMPDVVLKWVDVDENERLSVDMGVNQIPSIVLLRNQEVVDHIDGLIPRRRLAARMESFL